MVSNDCSISLYTTDILLRYKSEWDPRAHAHTKGGYLDGEIRVPRVPSGERMIMTLETFPADDVDPLIASLHPCLLHLVRMGVGKRHNWLEPVPTSTHWRQMFEVVDGKVWVVNTTSSLDVNPDGTKRDVPATDMVTELHGNRIILGSSKGHLNLVFLKPKRSFCDATISKVLANRLGITDEEQVTKYTNHFTGKKGSNNLIRIRLKVTFFSSSGEEIGSAVSPQTVVDNGSKRIGCMDMYEAWPRRSCALGGRKVIMVSEYELADDVEPKFEVYDSAGNQRPSVEDEWLVQPVNTSATMTVTNTTIIFLTPAQPNLRRIRESIGEFSLKLVARRRSDGLTSRTFNFQYVEHTEKCDHLVDSEDGVARIEKRTRARPNNKKRRMFKNDESSVGQSITESEHSRPPPKLEITRMSVPSMNISMNKSISQSELGDNSASSRSIEITRMSIPSSANQVLLGKRMKLSGDPTLSKTLLRETINWTLQPLDSKVDLTTILNHQREAPKVSSGGGGGPKIFLAPPEDESCHEDRRLVIDT